MLIFGNTDSSATRWLQGSRQGSKINTKVVWSSLLILSVSTSVFLLGLSVLKLEKLLFSQFYLHFKLHNWIKNLVWFSFPHVRINKPGTTYRLSRNWQYTEHLRLQVQIWNGTMSMWLLPCDKNASWHRVRTIHHVRFQKVSAQCSHGSRMCLNVSTQKTRRIRN